MTENEALSGPKSGSETAQTGSFIRLWEFAAPYKGCYALSIILAIIGVACGFAPYVATAVMATALLGGVRDFAVYLGWCGVAAVGQVAKAWLMGKSTVVSHRATFSVLSEIRRILAKKLDHMSLGYVLETPSGKLKASFVERTEQLETPLAHVVPEVSANVIVPLTIIAAEFAIDWRMALVSLITIPVGIGCYAIEMRDYVEKYGRVVSAKAHMGSTIVEYINGIEIIKAFGQSAASYRKFTDAVKTNSGLMIDWTRATLPWTAIMMSVWPAVLIGVLPVGCLLVLDGSLTVSSFITVAVLSLGIMGPLFAAILFTDDIAKIATIISEINEVLDQPEMNRPNKPAPVNGFRIELRNVGFSYGNVPVLKGVSLSIEQGSTVALVGPSGSGKSTIAKLIASLWDVESGSLLIGETDVREMPLSQVARLVAYVSQDNFLFDESVMENIRVGRIGATDDEVIACAKASGCHEFIEGLPQGYGTVVGGAGGHLSGGERQRIALARAMMKDSPIVVLDEATAYTDPENEANIQEAVGRLTKGKTLVVVAHRLSTIVGADKIVVVDNGRVIACAPHNQLLEDCLLYSDMWAAHIASRDTVEGGVYHV